MVPFSLVNRIKIYCISNKTEANSVNCEGNHQGNDGGGSQTIM